MLKMFVGFVGLLLLTIGLLLLTILSGVIYVFIKDRKRTVLQRQMNEEYEINWHFYQRGVDLMRRRSPNGEWQFRAMTDEEHRNHIADQW